MTTENKASPEEGMRDQRNKLGWLLALVSLLLLGVVLAYLLVTGGGLMELAGPPV